MTAIHVRRGLDPHLARTVAQQLMEHDALAAHARDEIGLSEKLAARPLQAALASGATFALGAAAPILTVAAEQILKIINARGACLVLDCGGVQATLDLDSTILGRNSIWTIVGLGGRITICHYGSTPYGCTMSIPYWSRAQSYLRS